jgi:hypothetical protein
MTRVSRLRAALVPLLGWPLAATPAQGQIQRHPTGVNVNATDATTVFISYGGLDGYVPVEASWCGEIFAAAPDVGFRCDPATLFGSLPIAYDLGRSSGVDGFTDIMSIPPSVARRAYQAAEGGANSAFFYVRRFVDPSGTRPDQYVPVTCRLTGGGARTPFALLDVRLEFASRDLVLAVEPGSAPPPVRARIAYNGTGQLVGRWEIVLPGEDPPGTEDLLTEATLPLELRGTQRRYTELERFNVFLPPTGEFTLPGPDVRRVPTSASGLHMILLRIEATSDKEGDSDLNAAGAGQGVVASGAVAGFPIPPLRYFVGGQNTSAPVAGFLALSPADSGVLAVAEAPVFTWTSVPAILYYRLQVQDEAGEEILSAVLQSASASYRAPDWLGSRANGRALRWRVLALGQGGRAVASTGWRTLRWASTVTGSTPLPPGAVLLQ